MFLFPISYIFILGAIIGSFLNVVILRLNTGRSILGSQERSHCFSCGKTLEWWELIPILSFFLLRGRCSKCKSKISWQYPLVELLTGIVFVLVFLKGVPTGDAPGFFYNAFIWSVLIAITFYDFRHKIIPNILVYIFILASFLKILFASPFPTINLLTGLAFFAFFGGLWLVSRGRWLGFGDAKLVVGIGFYLGLEQGISALVLAFWIGAGVSIIFLAISWLSRKNLIPKSRLSRPLQALTMKSEIPFAPFLILGTFLAFFLQLDILGISILFK